MSSKFIMYGYSSKGEMHKKNNLPNQDAWFSYKYFFGSLVVVADGMGSKKFSEFGSKMACKASYDAVNYWYKNKSSNVRHLLMILQTMWTSLVSVKYSDKESCSTILFALALNNGKLITAQLGDGIILVNRGKYASNLSKEREGFGNETYALGSTWNIDKWIINEFDITDDIKGIILATDGVADDLLKDKYLEFSEYILNISDEFPQKRWRILKDELENWPTPFSGDDKTIGVLKFI